MERLIYISVLSVMCACSVARGTEDCETCDIQAGRPSGLTTNVEWLNWKAHRQGLDYAMLYRQTWNTPIETKSLEYDRGNGARIGVGYRFKNCWQFNWNYTHLYVTAEASDVAENPSASNLIATRSFDTDHYYARNISASSSLNFNVNDVELSRWFCLSETIDLRLFGGFRWAIIDQKFDCSFAYTPSYQSNITNPTNLDAYGIRLGAEVNKSYKCGLGFFAKGATSVLAGQVDTLQREVGSGGTVIDYSDKYIQVIPVLEVAAGLSWTRGPLELACGYELNAWLNMAKLEYRAIIQRTSNIDSTSDLLLEGLFLRLSYNR